MSRESKFKLDVSKLKNFEHYRIKVNNHESHNGWTFGQWVSVDGSISIGWFWVQTDNYHPSQILDIRYEPVNPVPADEAITGYAVEVFLGGKWIKPSMWYSTTEAAREDHYRSGARGESRLINVTEETRVVKEGE